MNQQEDRSDLESLLSQIPPEEAEQLREVWDLSGNADPVSLTGPGDVEEALRRIEATLEHDGRHIVRSTRPEVRDHQKAHCPDRLPHTTRRASRIPIWAGLTAALVLSLLVGAGIYWWFSPITRIAQLGQRLALTLPDGSHVELNSGSRLRYPRRFGEKRPVALEGEAFFDVAKQHRPFVIRTFNAQVRVLGTRFSVRAWPGETEQGTTVALESGHVALIPTGMPDRTVTMAPGETRRVGTNAEGGPYSLPDVSVDQATAWRRGDLVYVDEPLNVILGDVERRFAVDIEVHPAALRQKRINLALRHPAGAEAVVRDLALALGLRFHAISNGFELYADDSPSV